MVKKNGTININIDLNLISSVWSEIKSEKNIINVSKKNPIMNNFKSQFSIGLKFFFKFI